MGIGWKELIIILLIAMLVFGAKKIRNIGSDLGAAVRGFKKSMSEGETEEQQRKLRHEEGDDADFGSTDTSTRNADAKSGGNRRV